ncbi:DUF2971 domain-containing protein [Moritella sp. 28]|uniref:DUF2971 domain-containing protein n=1 Tax=Moritella sp. 28 TaxID=2746232 RepID=UPI001BA9D4C6|nr:DUF2971 domain-containing protein [Moritella sp. 28]QUM85459.1 DUF2971 domain-containing protein [Moritella sp. 28]
MKFSSAPEFNDPFDCVVNYDVDSSIEAYMSRPEILDQIASGLGLSSEKVQDHSEELRERIRTVIESGAMHDTLMEKVGICSLSKYRDNILMWSHYADNHKGFVVEFSLDLNDERMVNNPEFCFGGNYVEYSHDMPVKVVGTNNFTDYYRQFLVKSQDWKYEQEYRVLSTNKGAGIHKFDPRLISSVIVGAKMPSENYRALMDEVVEFMSKYDHNISVQQAKIAQDKYELVFMNVT